ncbi:MAG: hypothetical protein ACM3NS_06330 [Deltaproteobacteria bacterium]
MTAPHRDLADYCQWWPVGERRACYAPAGLVLMRPGGQTLGFTCAAHASAWAGRIHGNYRVLERAEWEAQGAGYRGPALGG